MIDDESSAKRRPSPESAESRSPPRIPDYELLRVIGRGSYGEVWLGRNVMGGFRAIKVIYRHTFEHQRPYEREFEGIKRYEPVSRTHESQVAVLHVGRHLGDEYYYYVMELADPARLEIRNPKSEIRNKDSEARDWETYQPRTLLTELKQRGKLPLDECISLGSSLAMALDHLHDHGLIHRDIKPSNVIFVNGAPKLADIGLVAEKDSTVSFVGTRGYFPPEGPGTAQADLFSLGKVLYELSTGKDRNEFPDLPRDLDDLTDEGRFWELNEILLKACHGDPRQRYASARELRQDLSLLEQGKSIKQKRSRARFLALAQRIARVVALALFVGGGGYWIARKPGLSRPVTPRQLRIEKAELPGEHGLRNVDISADGEQILFTNENTISIWSKKTGMTHPLRLGIFERPEAGGSSWFLPRPSPVPRWSPDGQQFAFQAERIIGSAPDESTNVFALFLVDSASGETRQIGSELLSGTEVRELTWLPDGKAVTYLDAQRRIYSLSLKGGRSLWVDANLPSERGVRLGSYSPNGNWLLVSALDAKNTTDAWDIWLMPHLGGRAVRITDRPGFDGDPTWGLDGETIYFTSSNGQPGSQTWGIWKVRVDARTGAPKGRSQPVLVKNSLKLRWPQFVASGRRLIYEVMEPNTRILVAKADRLDQPTEGPRGFNPLPSPDGRTIYFAGEAREQKGIFAIDRTGENQSLRQVTKLVPLGSGLTRGGISLAADGKRIAFTAYDEEKNRLGIFVVPTAGGVPVLVQELAEDAVLPVWSPDSQWLAYTEDHVLYRASYDGHRHEALATLYRWDGWTVRWSLDGLRIAALGYEDPKHWPKSNGVFVVKIADKFLKKLTPESEGYKEGLEWHPNGNFLTYMLYGPEKYGAQIRRAYLNDRPTDLMIDQPDHWDYVGQWDTTGEKFFFNSGGAQCPTTNHLFELANGRITHGLEVDPLTLMWSQDQQTAVWSKTQTFRYLEELEGVR